VTDGRLTVRSGAGAVNNKISFAEIDRLDAAPAGPAAPAPFAAVAESPGRVRLSWGAVPFAGGYVLRRTGGAGGPVTRILPAGATNFTDEGVAPDTAYAYTLTAYDPRGESPPATASATTPPTPAVVGRWVFYNGSRFDGNGEVVDDRDLAAIATDKAALLPGGAASFANVTSYTKGINGLLVDLAGVSPATDLTAAEFEFRAGLTGNPSSWPFVAATPAVTRLAGLTAAHGGRFAIAFPDGSIRNTWLRVTVKATPATGLSAADVFYLGNLVGETGDSTSGGALRVTAGDVLRTRRALSPGVAVDNRYDFNRDGRVSPQDLAVVRSAQRRSLALLTVPAAPPTGTVRAPRDPDDPQPVLPA
ncbi:MAG TPA: hypothetical protein VFB66_31710, partial [Tepidisphaeraceae bacterium]|nr:hypothetical protein [Tepidisphaeraceae bacterium]